MNLDEVNLLKLINVALANLIYNIIASLTWTNIYMSYFDNLNIIVNVKI